MSRLDAEPPVEMGRKLDAKMRRNIAELKRQMQDVKPNSVRYLLLEELVAQCEVALSADATKKDAG